MSEGKYKPKAGTKKGVRTDSQGKKEARRKRLDLASLPGKRRTSKDQHGNRTGVVKTSSDKQDRETQSKTYGWMEDVPGRPDLVRVKQRKLLDHPEGRGERDYCAASLEEGRPDGGSRVGDRRKYNKNYDDIFGGRKRGVAAGHKKFKKKY